MSSPPPLTDDLRARVAAEAARQVEATLESHPDLMTADHRQIERRTTSG